MNFNDWIGTAGVGLILLAFFLQTFKFLDSDSNVYYLMNVVGAALACYASWLISYWPFVVLEGTWTIVSLAGLIKRK